MRLYRTVQAHLPVVLLQLDDPPLVVAVFRENVPGPGQCLTGGGIRVERAKGNVAGDAGQHVHDAYERGDAENDDDSHEK